MANRTCSIFVEIWPVESIDGAWSVQVEDFEGDRSQKSGYKMSIVTNSLEMAGRAVDDFIEKRKFNQRRK